MRKVHALLIGIDEYAHIRNLGGCRLDIQKVDQYLNQVATTSGFQYLSTTLFDAQATRNAVIANFQKNLIEAVHPGDVALIYFSGHGAQEEAGELFAEAEYDGKLEGWVCHDTGLEPGQARLFVDKELRYLISSLSAKGADVVVISDSCHSGDNHRSAQVLDEPEGETLVRRTGITMPARKYQDFLFAADIAESRFRTEPLSQVIPTGRLIAVAACDDWEFAYEKSGIGGVFTHFLLKTLGTTQGRITYHDLQSRVKALIKKELPDVSQVPRAAAVEGFEDDLFREFLSGAVKKRPMAANLINLRHRKGDTPESSESLWQMDKGQIHGVQPSKSGEQESLVAIPLPEGKTAYGYVTEVETRHSTVVINPRESSFILLQPENSYTGYLKGIMSQGLNLHLHGETEGVNRFSEHIENHKADLDRWKLRFRYQKEGCQYGVKALHVNRVPYLILTKLGDDRPLVKQVKGWGESSFETLVSQLREAQRWQFVKGLSNSRPDALAKDSVEIELYQKGKKVSLAANEEAFDLEYDQGNQVRPTGKLKIKLVNRSQDELYVGLLYLDTNFVANPGLLRPTVVKLNPHQEIWAIEGREISLGLDAYIRQFNWPETVLFLKVIYSTSPITVDEFTQKGLERPSDPWPDDRSSSKGLDWGQDEEEQVPSGT